MEPTPCDFIVHVGDVGNADMPAHWILDRLREIAPLVAVSGNCDDPDQYVLEGKPLPLYVVFEEGDIRFAVFHDPKDLRAAIKGGLTNPAYIVPEPRVQIHGHTHVYHVSKHQSGIVMICPGAVTNPQGGNPPTLAILKIEGPDKLLSVDIVTL